MITTDRKKYTIQSDNRTVWINGLDGVCIGRFSRFGVDVHRDFAGQFATGTECLDCFKRTSDPDYDWRSFKESMRKHYHINVPDKHQPCREEIHAT